MRLDEIAGWLDRRKVIKTVIKYYEDNWDNPDKYVESPTKRSDGSPYQFSKTWNLSDGWELEYFRDIRGSLVSLRQNGEDQVGWVWNHALGGKDDVIVNLSSEELQGVLGA